MISMNRLGYSAYSTAQHSTAQHSTAQRPPAVRFCGENNWLPSQKALLEKRVNEFLTGRKNKDALTFLTNNNGESVIVAMEKVQNSCVKLECAGESPTVLPRRDLLSHLMERYDPDVSVLGRPDLS